MLKNIKSSLTPFQWFEVLAVTGFTIYFAAIDRESSWWYLLISSAAAVCGIFCVVLCAAGKKSQYYWGFVNITAYIMVAWYSRYYGEVMLNALYYLPTQFVGMYFWNKHYSQTTGIVKCKKMKPSLTAVLVAASAVCIWLYHIFQAGRKRHLAGQRQHDLFCDRQRPDGTPVPGTMAAVDHCGRGDRDHVGPGRGLDYDDHVVRLPVERLLWYDHLDADEPDGKCG